ncbi:DUF1616 domain-containing protein [Vulcanisaeta distributa]|uniref:DUF1616 domain-containing protein n=1 Tax=Vulcanisaeta distributa (strain DSM 14429 / JCM 11212 / NBRC 100878 / IC-017) TaxID=572478 RepID=E1QUB6_VULDI|nr:DUF1616 domain-containing protein [Vulcanisaeta distributa]ADN49842.1 Protein of unknown function DUF1616 [Vulcanisaeta distributa DSM 14429]
MDNRDIRNAIKNAINTNQCASVSELVTEVSRALGVPKGLVAYEVMMMWKNGELELEGVPRNSVAYVFSVEGLWYWVSLALVTASILAVTLIGGGPLIYLRYGLGALMLLFMPGYALVESLYPRGDELSPLERLALSIGLSLAVLPLIGLVLNYTPWGIRFVPIVVSTNAVTVTLLTVALVRKARIFEAGEDRCQG